MTVTPLRPVKFAMLPYLLAMTLSLVCVVLVRCHAAHDSATSLYERQVLLWVQVASISRGFTPTRTKEWLRVAAEATVFKWLIMDPLCAPACLRAARLFGGSNTHVTRWRCVSRQVLVSMPCRRWRAVECANPLQHGRI